MKEVKYDVIRGADIYRGIRSPRLESWILKGIIKQDEALVRRSGLIGWRKPEEFEELKPFFERREKEVGKKKEKVRPLPVPKKLITNILIIDDEEDLCWLLSNTLRTKRYNVSTANALSDAMVSLKEAPDLIFLDLKLPDGNGMDLLPKIKEITPQSLIVIISAYGGEEKRAEAEDKGVHDFIDKPCTEEAILQTIKKFQKND